MSILSTIEAAANVGPYPVKAIGSTYFVGPWPIAADGTAIGPYPIDNTNNLVGPWQFATIGGQQFLGPYAVE